MKCITFGVVVLLFIIITSIVAIIIDYMDNSNLEKLRKNFEIQYRIAHISIVILLSWWIYGWIIGCEDGYFLSRGLNIH